MRIFRGSRFLRRMAALLVAALLLPTLVACTTPRPPRSVELAAIVVDGVRLSESGEAGGYRLVRIIRDGGLIPVRAGMALRSGDRVETADRVDAVIRYPSGSEIFMRPLSGGRIGSFTDMVGEVFARIKGLFSVDTTFVKAGALGTSYLVRAAAGGPATVVVFEGRVRCESPTRAWAPVDMGPGRALIAHGQGVRAQPASTAEMRDTLEWVERMEKLAPAPRGVSGEAVAIGAAALLAAILLSRGSGDDPERGTDRQPDGAEHRSPESSADRDAPSVEFRLPPFVPPPPPPPPRPPDGLTPGSTDPRKAPALACRSPLTLRWEAVDGADDYVVAAELQPMYSRGWRELPSRTTRSTRTSLDEGLNGLVRWSVRARAAGAEGPASTPRYLRCTTAAPR